MTKNYLKNIINLLPSNISNAIKKIKTFKKTKNINQLKEKFNLSFEDIILIYLLGKHFFPDMNILNSSINMQLDRLFSNLNNITDNEDIDFDNIIDKLEDESFNETDYLDIDDDLDNLDNNDDLNEDDEVEAYYNRFDDEPDDYDGYANDNYNDDNYDKDDYDEDDDYDKFNYDEETDNDNLNDYDVDLDDINILPEKIDDFDNDFEIDFDDDFFDK